MTFTAEEVATMSVIVFLVALYALANVIEGLDILFSAIHAVMSSWPGIIAVVAVTAWMTYRWYRNRYIA